MNPGMGVLIVEDDEDDLFLTQRVVRRHCQAGVYHVESGRAAIDYLSGVGPFADRSKYPLPEVVFLDLKMEDLNGHDVLAWAQEHLGEHAPRIFVLTGSNEPRDHERVRSSGVAAGYIVKPLLEEHLDAIFGKSVASD